MARGELWPSTLDRTPRGRNTGASDRSPPGVGATGTCLGLGPHSHKPTTELHSCTFDTIRAKFTEVVQI